MCFTNIQIRATTCVVLRNITTFSLKHGSHCFYKSQRMSSSVGENSTMQLSKQLPWVIDPCFKFADCQKELLMEDLNVADIVAEKTARKEVFYGIETKPLNQNKTACLDFNMFLPHLPVFISIVWTKRFSEAIRDTSMANVPNIQLMPHLIRHIPAMPHIAVYRLIQKDLDDFLALNLNNVLVIRGDHIAEGQEFSYAYQAVEYLRRARKDLAIAVAGYPEGYTSISTGPSDKAQDIAHLKLKMDAGADFIVTQVCYSGDTIVEFLRDARNAGITAPIMLGILIPETYARYQRMSGFSNVVLGPEALAELEKIKEDDEKVQEYFVQLSVRNILQTLEANLGVYGIHFYTLNRFPPVLDAISELRRLGILKTPSTDQ